MPIATVSTTTKTVKLDDEVVLDCAERGARGGVPVVFLHGVTDSWRSFEAVMTRLPESVHAIAISQRGHGDSSRPASGYLIADFSHDLERLLDRLEIPAAFVVGHSMGSFVAQRFAIDRPERTLGLVLMGSSTNMRHSETVREYYATTVSTLRDPIDPAVAREFQVSTVARPTAPGLIDAAVLESLKVPARVWREAFAGFVELDHTPELGHVTAPALIVNGDADAFFSVADQHRLRDAIPGATLVIYAGGGHAAHWEDPDTVARDVTSFILGTRE